MLELEGEKRKSGKDGQMLVSVIVRSKWEAKKKRAEYRRKKMGGEEEGK